MMRNFAILFAVLFFSCALLGITYAKNFTSDETEILLAYHDTAGENYNPSLHGDFSQYIKTIFFLGKIIVSKDHHITRHLSSSEKIAPAATWASYLTDEIEKNGMVFLSAPRIVFFPNDKESQKEIKVLEEYKASHPEIHDVYHNITSSYRREDRRFLDALKIFLKSQEGFRIIDKAEFSTFKKDNDLLYKIAE